MTTSKKTVTEAKPANYAVWAKDAADGTRRLKLVVTTKAGRVEQTYYVVPREFGYTLVKDAVGATRDLLYNVTTTWADWTCNCPDRRRNDRDGYNCKHVRGLRAALAKRSYPETL